MKKIYLLIAALFVSISMLISAAKAKQQEYKVFFPIVEKRVSCDEWTSTKEECWGR